MERSLKTNTYGVNTGIIFEYSYQKMSLPARCKMGLLSIHFSNVMHHTCRKSTERIYLSFDTFFRAIGQDLDFWMYVVFRVIECNLSTRNVFSYCQNPSCVRIMLQWQSSTFHLVKSIASVGQVSVYHSTALQFICGFHGW